MQAQGRRTGEQPSIFDVAARAGVSASTVSRSLRGMPNVAASTRERVARAAAELDYVVSPAASGLASGRMNAVGIVVPYVSRWFFMQVVQGASEELRARGFDLLLFQLGGREGRERFFDRLPLNRRVDAALLVDVALQPDEQSRLQMLGIPITSVSGAALGVGTVGIDEVAGVRLLVDHLVELGHREIGMLCGRAEEGLQFAIPHLRQRGFRDSLRAAGIEVREEWIRTAPWGMEGGAVVMRELLDQSSRPTAIFAESDEIAFGALRTLREAGVDVPRDISVVGFDDHELASVVDLTTVAQPVADLGRTGAVLVLEALAGCGDPFAQVTLPTHLVVRGSTAPPDAQMITFT